MPAAGCGAAQVGHHADDLLIAANPQLQGFPDLRVQAGRRFSGRPAAGMKGVSHDDRTQPHGLYQLLVLFMPPSQDDVQAHHGGPLFFEQGPHQGGDAVARPGPTPLAALLRLTQAGLVDVHNGQALIGLALGYRRCTGRDAGVVQPPFQPLQPGQGPGLQGMPRQHQHQAAGEQGTRHIRARRRRGSAPEPIRPGRCWRQWFGGRPRAKRPGR